MDQTSVLTVARPYLQFIALLALSPPPPGYNRSLHFWHAVYTLLMSILGAYVSYINIVAVVVEVHVFELEDFTKALGIAQKVCYSIFLVSIHLNKLIHYRRLESIFKQIETLDRRIRGAALLYGGFQQKIGFRWRLAMRCGFQILVTIFMVPTVTTRSLSDWMNLLNLICTEFVLVMLELKCSEYCLHVLLVEQLLLRLRYTLCQIQVEVTNCQQGEMVRPLCDALRCNQQLVASIWRLVEELESYFMLPMLCLFLFNGLSVLHVANWSYIQAENPIDCCRYWRMGMMSFMIFNLLVACWTSNRCIDTYNSFTRILHRTHSPHPMITMRVREYELQMQHLKLRFTCGGLFDINLKYFGALILTIAIYTVILIQFKIQTNLDKWSSNF